MASKMFEGLSGSPQAGKARPSSSGGGGGSVGGGGVSEQQKQVVQTMQRVMGDLAGKIGSNIDGAAERAHQLITANNEKASSVYPDVQSLMSAARAWGMTSAGGTSGTYDGIWGGNTSKALSALNEFVKNAGITGVIIQPGQGSPYKDMEDANVIKLADQNIKNLVRLFSSLGAQAPEDAKVAAGLGAVLDKVPQQLTVEASEQNPWPEHVGNMTVRARDVRDLMQFILFISRLSYTPCEPLPEKRKKASSLEEAADMILKGSLFRIAAPGDAEREQAAGEAAAESSAATEAQEAAQGAGAVRERDQRARSETEEARKEKERTEVDGVCWNSVYDYIQWFQNRAWNILNQITEAAEGAQPHPIQTNRVANKTDIDKARAYYASIQNLDKVWGKYKEVIADVIRERYNPNAPVVNSQVLRDAKRAGAGAVERGGPAAGMHQPGSDGGKAFSGTGMERGAQSPGDGPIQPFMNLRSARDKYALDRALEPLSKIENMTGDFMPDIDIKEWRGRNWVTMAQRYIEGDSTAEKLRKFPEYAGSILEYIQGIYKDWRNEWEGDIAPGILRDQNRKLGQWEQIINSQVRRAQNSMARAISQYERLEGTGPQDKEQTQKQKQTTFNARYEWGNEDAIRDVAWNELTSAEKRLWRRIQRGERKSIRRERSDERQEARERARQEIRNRYRG